MKAYRNFDTGECFTEEEIKESYEMFSHELPYKDFDEYIDTMLKQGREKTGGLIEIDNQKFYIVDNHGNVCGEADSKVEIDLLLSYHSQEEIEREGLEIIIG